MRALIKWSAGLLVLGAVLAGASLAALAQQRNFEVRSGKTKGGIE